MKKLNSMDKIVGFIYFNRKSIIKNHTKLNRKTLSTHSNGVKEIFLAFIFLS